MKLPFFKKSLHSLSLVLCLEALGEILLLYGDGMVQIREEPVHHRPLAVSHSDGRVGRDLLCQLHDCRHQLLSGIYAVYQADPVRFIGFDVLAGEYHFFCLSGPNDSHKALGPSKARGDPQAHLRLPEHCIVGAVADVTAHGQLVAAAKGKSIDSRNGGDRKRFQLPEDIVSEFSEFTAFLYGHGAHGRNVGSGHKGLLPGSGHDDGPCLIQVDIVDHSIQVL